MPLNAEALIKLFETLKSAKWSQVGDQLGSLGRVFSESAEANPYYFQVPKTPYPSGDLAELSTKHGINMSKSSRGNAIYANDGDRVGGYPRDASMGRIGSVADVYGANPFAYRDLGQAVKRGELSLVDPLFGIDTSDLRMGAGSAKKIYPALWEYMLAHGGANITDTGLSFNNTKRRSINMSGALEKWGKPAGDRIRINDEQISGQGNGINREAEYHALSNDQKIGLLNATVAPRTAKDVNLRLSELVDNRDPEALSKIDRLGLRDRGYGLWEPSTDVDPHFFSLLSDVLKGQPGRPQVAGEDSLRRTALTFDHLRNGLTAQDLEAQPYLTDRLARKSGGLIPAGKPGALTQTCACGGR